MKRLYYQCVCILATIFSISTWILFTSFPLSINTDKSGRSHKVKSFYWILTTEKYHETRCQGIIDSWGKWTKNLVFMSNVESDLPSIAINEKDEFLDRKELASWKLIYEKYYDEFDWFIKGDDDTFFVVPNLEALLSQLDPNKPYFLGRRFLLHYKDFVYPSGGAGYVLSKTALRLLNREIDSCISACVTPKRPGDSAIGLCMKKAGIIMSETRDKLGRERFHPFAPKYHLNYISEMIRQNGSGLYPKYSWYGLNEGPNCCPPSTISFHYLNPQAMKELHNYLINKSSQTSWESLFGDYSPIDIDISGQSVEVEKIDFLPSDCLSDCQKKYEKEIQRKACHNGCELLFYGLVLETPSVRNCKELKSETGENVDLVDICLKQMWPFD